IPIKLIGKIGSGDHESRLGIEADLTSLKLDNILPGWVKEPRKSSKATFNVVQKAQSTRFEDIVVDGGGVSIKGSLEVDQNGKLRRDATPVTADLRRAQGREVIYLETSDAGAFFRFTDSYSKMVGGQLELAMDPPTVEPSAKEGLMNVRNFQVKGESALDRVA